MMNNQPAVVVGSVARSYEGKDYYRVTAKAATGLVTFKSPERTASGQAVLLDIYSKGDTLWDGSKAEADFAVCKLDNFDIEVAKTADALLEELKGMTL